MNYRILLSLFTNLLVYCYGHQLCNKGPQYWCLDEKTAEDCGVVEFCKINNLIKSAENTEPLRFTPSSAKASPVNVSLYYESLCPGCRIMIMSQIYPTYLALNSTGILNIFLYPYGNAAEHEISGKWSFVCQHGRKECEVNVLEACALHLLPPAKRVPYILCIEKNPSIQMGRECAAQLAVEWGPLIKCYYGPEGNALEHQIAVKTDALNPRHNYVPWITVNGVHSDEIQNKVSVNMLKYVCSIYAGPKPIQCHSGPEQQQLRRVEACYREQK